MAIKNISVGNAEQKPDVFLTPEGSNLPGNPSTTNALDPQDRIVISSDGGSAEILRYTVEAAAGEDSLTLNGSPIESVFDMGEENDVFAINTIDLGGSMVFSTVIGGLGNDVLDILVNGSGVTNSFIDTDNGAATFGSDLLRLRGSFSENEIFMRGGADVLRFQAPGNDGFNNFSTNFVSLGAGAEGLDIDQLSMTAKDAQLLESRQWNVVDIARAFGVPPFLVGETTKQTSWGSGIEQLGIGFVVYTLMPHLRRFQVELNRKLFARTDYFCEFNTAGLLRGDNAGRAEYYKAALGGTQNPAWMTADEVRRLENLAARGGEADELSRPEAHSEEPSA